LPLLGTPVRRVEDARFLTGDSNFIADLDLPGVLEVAYVTAPVAHAVIRNVEVAAAEQAPGVVLVVTAVEVDLPEVPPINPAFPAAMRRSILASGRVRYVGEPVVAIVAESVAAAEDAAELVEVDYEPLPAVVDAEEAARDEILLFPEAGTNLVLRQDGGTSAASLPSPNAGDEVVVDGRFVNQRIAPCPLEGRAGASQWGDDGRLTHWSSCQGPHPVRAIIASLYGLDPASVRAIAPDVGGSFGAKARPYPEELLLPWLARRAGRPVRWVPPRSTDMVGLGHSRAQIQTVQVRGTRDGTLRSVSVHILSDAGAYPLVAPLLAANTGRMAGGAYNIPSVTWSADSVLTNTTPVVSFRGAGRPEAGALIERAVDLFAAKIGLDPVEVRRRNLLCAEDFPYSTPTGITHDSGDYHKALDLALARAGYDGLRAEQSRRRLAGEQKLIGIGVATFVDRTAGVPGPEYGSVELRPGGELLVRTGSSPYGQGHHTAWAMIASDRTGIPMELIEVVHGDTDLVPRGGITGGSKSAQKAGSAVAEAADGLVQAAREAAAEELEAAPEDVVFSTSQGGRFHVAGTPAVSIGWAEVAQSRPNDPLACESDFTGGGATFPFGAYVAVVEVDVETGAVELTRMVSVDDAGTILNPLLALGQVHGGVAQGVAQALLEEMVYDSAGNPLTSTFADYAVISAAELPEFECELVETPSPHNPLGAKGIAESGVIGAPPAVQNAVVDALSHMGVRHIDMPLGAERVWRAIREAGGEEPVASRRPGVEAPSVERSAR
jgi:carbon-monoxide dehydrogenase large subunit